jgi:hypothetical protein
MAVLERLREIVSGDEAEAFYLRLLATPIKNRPALLLGFATTLEGDARRQFVTAFAAANVTLRTRRPQGSLTL